MFKKLQEKWGVSTQQFWILFLVFGLTGCTTAVFTRYVAGWARLTASSFWVWKLLLRLGMLVFGYQFILLTYAALLGQWHFFWKYERRLLQKLGIIKTEKREVKRETVVIAVFASGAGTNAGKIIQYLKNNHTVKVGLVVCNKPGAGVIGIAEKNGIPVLLIDKESFFRGDSYIPRLKKYGIDFIVLAGFLWKIPAALIAAYPDKIINIHPALLPKYGGKGMYGMKVHEAVIAAGEKESGITIHYVNEHFDEGAPIFQARCIIDENETPESLANKIHVLEHEHFPKVIVKLLTTPSSGR